MTTRDILAIGAFAAAVALSAGSFADDTAIAPAPTTVAVTTTTSTTTTVPAHRPIMEAGQPPVPTTVALGFDPVCGEALMRLALHVGWPADQLPMLDRVARRESGGDCGNTDSNYSHNVDDPMGGSRGTLQVNGYWCSSVKYNPGVGGWLGEHGLLDDCDDLFNTTINLQAGLLIWQRGGWSAWGF